MIYIFDQYHKNNKSAIIIHLIVFFFQEGNKNLRYNGFVDCASKIYRSEGISALYSGITPAILRQSVYGTLKFGTYYTLKNIIIRNLYNDEIVDENMYINVSCAALAGATSSAIANPTDVLKVRMQVHGKGSSNQALYKHFYEVFVTEGVRGLYRGVSQTSQRAATIAAVELPVYDFCKLKLIDKIGNNTFNHFLSSFIASFLAAVASCPIDVIRSRLMNQRKILRNYGTTTMEHTTNAYFANSFECFSSILRNEGVGALWKGFMPR